MILKARGVARKGQKIDGGQEGDRLGWGRERYRDNTEGGDTTASSALGCWLALFSAIYSSFWREGALRGQSRY